MIYNVYSRPKVGKTTLSLKDAPKNKTAILSADKGLLGIDTTGIKVEEDTSSKNLNKLMSENSTFIRSHTRIVIDTATALHANMLFEMARGGQPSQPQYGAANNALLAFVRTLKNYPEKQVIILSQEKLILPNEDWVSDDADEDTGVMTTVDLSPGATSGLMQMSDVIARLYIAHVDGKPVRRLWLGPSSSIVAGARSKVYKGNPPFLKQPSITRLNQLLGWTR